MGAILASRLAYTPNGLSCTLGRLSFAEKPRTSGLRAPNKGQNAMRFSRRRACT
jgi:hypothetical protein